MFRSHTIRAGFCFYLRPTNPYGFFPSQIQLAEISKFKSLLKRMSFGGGVADKDLTFNQKFLRRGSGRVEELEEQYVEGGDLELVTCNISEQRSYPQVSKHILVHSYVYIECDNFCLTHPKILRWNRKMMVSKKSLGFSGADFQVPG